MTKVLVTGAAGFIGSHLCEALVETDHEVVGLDSFTPFYDDGSKRRNIAGLLGSSAFELIEGDLLTVPLDVLLDGVDAVAHLAGQPGVTTSWGSEFARYVDDNVVATQRLLEAATRKPLRRFVYASSSSVYGRPAAELTHLGLRPASPYGVSKLAAELLVDAYSHSFGVHGVSLRYFSVYGPRQRPDMAVHRFIEAMLDGKPVTIFGDGGQSRDFTYVGDVVDATMRALFVDVPPALVLDVAAGTPVTVDTLITELRDQIGISNALRELQDERAGDVPRTKGSPTPAQEHLGWTPATDLRTGLANQIAWHRGIREFAGHPSSAAKLDVVPDEAVSG